MSTYPSISKVQGNLYAQTNTLSTDYGSGQLWCDNDIIIQDATTTDTRNIKTLGANLNIVGNNVTINPTGASAGELNIVSYNTSSWTNNSGNLTIQTGGSTNELLLSNGNGSLALNGSTSTLYGNAMNVNGSTVTIASDIAGGGLLNLGTDNETGTIQIGNAASSNGKVLDIYGNYAVFETSSGFSLQNSNSGGVQITNIFNGGAVNIGNDSNTGSVGIGSSLKTVGMTGSAIGLYGPTTIQGGAVDIMSSGTLTLNAATASQAIYLGTDTNAGTITIGSSNKTLSIAAATTISGNLNVTGTTTTMNSTNTTFTDNVITLHALPSSQADSVVLYQRYPTDVVTESTNASNAATYAYTLTCTSVSSGTSLTCSALGGATVLTIIGCMIQNNSNNLYVTAATGSGPYTLTVSAAFSVATGPSVLAYCRLSAGLLYTENASTKGFNLAYYQAIGETTGDFSVSQQPAYADLRCNNIFASGTISGAGSGGSYTFQVSIVSTTGAAQTLPSTYAAVTTTGSYMVIISPVVAGNATATFMISKALATLANGNVFRLTSAAGTVGTGPYEELGMQWGANILPQVYLSTLGTQASITYNVRVIAN